MSEESSSPDNERIQRDEPIDAEDSEDYSNIIDNGGETVTEFYKNEGINGDRKNLLDGVRKGETSVGQISNTASLLVHNIKLRHV